MLKLLKEAEVAGKRVLVRCDFNVPVNDKGEITDDFRIRATIPTIEYLLKNNAKIILMSHFGRPKGVDLNYSLRVVQDRLSGYLNVSVGFAPDCVGSQVEEIVNDMAVGDIVLLENLRFHAGEEDNDEEFARKLAALGDIFVNDAFGASHRAHASIAGVPKFLPAYAGLLLAKEVQFLSQIITNPQRPFILVMGGAKAKEKLGALEACLAKADHVCFGGILANTLLKAQGILVGRSKAEEVSSYANLNLFDPKIHLPVDVVAADDIENPTRVVIKAIGQVKEDEYILDIGPETRLLFESIIGDAGTIFWNGPMGLFEKPQFSQGTESVARAIAANKGVKVVGGGEAAQALGQFGLTDSIDHISTGGGAMLEFLAGKRLPGLEALGYYN